MWLFALDTCLCLPKSFLFFWFLKIKIPLFSGKETYFSYFNRHHFYYRYSSCTNKKILFDLSETFGDRVDLFASILFS